MLGVIVDLQREDKACARIRKAKALQLLGCQPPLFRSCATTTRCARSWLGRGRLRASEEAQSVTIVVRLAAPSYFRVRAVEWLISGDPVQLELILAGRPDIFGRSQFGEPSRVAP